MDDKKLLEVDVKKLMFAFQAMTFQEEAAWHWWTLSLRFLLCPLRIIDDRTPLL